MKTAIKKLIPGKKDEDKSDEQTSSSTEPKQQSTQPASEPKSEPKEETKQETKEETNPATTTTATMSEGKMKALHYDGPFKVSVKEIDRPQIQHPDDAIIKVSTPRRTVVAYWRSSALNCNNRGGQWLRSVEDSIEDC